LDPEPSQRAAANHQAGEKDMNYITEALRDKVTRIWREEDCALSACWSLEDGNGMERIGEALVKMRWLENFLNR
jgi:hypothetical protein